jgi:hypothetical protein
MKQPGFEQPTIFPDLAVNGQSSGARQVDPAGLSRDIAAGAAQQLPADPGNGSPARVEQVGNREPVALSPVQEAAFVMAGMIVDPRITARVRAHQDIARRQGLGGDEALRELSRNELAANQTGMAALRAAAGVRPKRT